MVMMVQKITSTDVLLFSVPEKVAGDDVIQVNSFTFHIDNLVFEIK